MDSAPFAVNRRGKSVSFVPFGGKIEKRMRKNQFYEQEMLEYIELLGFKGIYADLGAYVGTHALYFATYCPATKVVAFEPRSRCFDLLSQNVALNEGASEKVELHKLGVSDREEDVEVTLDRKLEKFHCRPVDDVVQGDVAVMKIDVEGMESRVLKGAERILSTSKPVIYFEAHTKELADEVMAVLEPFGYELTGRVFNATATYETAARSSSIAPISKLPRAQSLLEPDLWHSESDAIEVSWKDGSLHMVSRLKDEETAHVTQSTRHLKRPPVDSPILVDPKRPCFVQVEGGPAEGTNATLFMMEYPGPAPNGIVAKLARAVLRKDEPPIARTAVHRLWTGERSFPRFELDATTGQLRLAFRFTGPGEWVVDRLAVHN